MMRFVSFSWGLGGTLALLPNSISPLQGKLPPLLHSGFVNQIITLEPCLTHNTFSPQEVLEAPLTFFIFKPPASKIMPHS